MKLVLLFVSTFISLLNRSECGSTNWLPNIIDLFTNRTSQITNYVIGRNLKNYYVQNVTTKINSSLLTYPNQRNIMNTVDIKDENARVKSTWRDLLEDEAKRKARGKISDETVNTENCSTDDPTIYFNTPQLIAFNGYPAESHMIITSDGYILTVHRIPYNKKGPRKAVPRKTVLLHHGLLGSSADWVIAGPKKGLAYILSDAGYDVWLANVRGNTYSRAHVSRNIDSYAFWNFTFHDVSQHDLPAVIDYILDTKGWDVKINYIGHSMGTSIMFALLSTKPQYNKLLRAGFALAPVAYMSDIKSPLKLLAKFSDNIAFAINFFGQHELLPQSPLMKWLLKHVCHNNINNNEILNCENLYFILFGFDHKQFNKCLLPFIHTHLPAGASTKTLLHYAQEINNNGTFQQFDYELEGNIQQYGKEKPPAYPVHNITLPIALFSAQNDLLSSVVDAKNLHAKLRNPIEHYIVPLRDFNHIDFLWAVDAPTLVYAKLLRLMEESYENGTLTSRQSETPLK